MLELKKPLPSSHPPPACYLLSARVGRIGHPIAIPVSNQIRPAVIQSEDDALAFVGEFRRRRDAGVDNMWIVKPIGELRLHGLKEGPNGK